MASESCTSIVDWLLDVEASAYREQSSLPDATSSPPIYSSSPPPSPCFVGSQHPRKRKRHKDWIDSHPKDPYFSLKEIMSLPNKRARTDSGHLEEERAAQAEVRSVTRDTSSSKFLTIINSNAPLEHPEKKTQSAHNLSYKHPLPLARSPRHQVAQRKRVYQVCLSMPIRYGMS